MKRLKILKLYAGIMSAVAVFVIFLQIMWTCTNMDLLEIIVIYGAFLYVPAFFLPFLIIGGEEL